MIPNLTNSLNPLMICIMISITSASVQRFFNRSCLRSPSLQNSVTIYRDLYVVTNSMNLTMFEWLNFLRISISETNIMNPICNTNLVSKVLIFFEESQIQFLDSHRLKCFYVLPLEDLTIGAFSQTMHFVVLVGSNLFYCTLTHL